MICFVHVSAVVGSKSKIICKKMILRQVAQEFSGVIVNQDLAKMPWKLFPGRAAGAPD